ncbi:MAG: glycosyltransferase family 4 protein, partial [Patescibacteria group bacterium]
IPFAMEYPENLETPYAKYFVSRVQTSSNERSSAGLYAHVRTFARMLYSFQARRRLATLIYETKPDLCHIHNIYTQISPSILHTLSDQHVPTVMTVHDHHLISPQYNIWAEGCGTDYRNVGLFRGTLSRFHQGSLAASFAQIVTYKFHRALRLYEKHVGLFIAPSEYLKRQLVAGGFPKEKIRVNHYGIDAGAIEPSYKHNGYFLFVGRLSEEKGIETIIRMAKLLPDIVFKIVGRGPQMDALHHLAHDASNVEFVGFRSGEELRELYRGACGVLLPSRVHEVFPLVLLEALAAGKPVIASHVGGIPEIIDDRLTGFLVPPTDIHAWTEAVLRLFHDSDLQARMSREARNAVETRFRLDDHYRRLMNIYQEVR